jgi:hypothetical protein
MHNQWEELIPFYIANTLPPKQARALESHLASCEMCRQSVEQWRAIAGAVKEEATSQARGLPPLSPQIRHTIATQRPRPDAAVFKPQRRSWQPTYVAVAAAAAILIAAGVLAVLMTGANHGPTRQGSSIASLFTPTGTRGTPQPTAQSSATHATQGNDLGIVTPTTIFINTPLPTPTPPATVTPVRLQPSPQPPTEIPTTSASFSSTNLTLSSCTVVSTGGGAVAAMNWPDINSGLAGYLQPNVHQPAIVVAGGGWYEIYLPDAGTIGWVSDTNVTLEGDCSSLPDPSPTYTVEQSGQCTVATASGTNVNVYAGPGTSYAILISFGRDDRPVASDTSDNNWYRISYWVGGSLWTGWVPAGDIYTMGDCTHLGMIPAAGYLPDHSPIETPTLPAYVPAATPTAGFNASIGAGSFTVVLLADTGTIPAGTRVAIGSAFYDGTSWYYGVYTETGASADAVPESQLSSIAPG